MKRRESGAYADGAEFDPFAPWNEGGLRDLQVNVTLRVESMNTQNAKEIIEFALREFDIDFIEAKELVA